MGASGFNYFYFGRKLVEFTCMFMYMDIGKQRQLSFWKQNQHLLPSGFPPFPAGFFLSVMFLSCLLYLFRTNLPACDCSTIFRGKSGRKNNHDNFLLFCFSPSVPDAARACNLQAQDRLVWGSSKSVWPCCTSCIRAQLRFKLGAGAGFPMINSQSADGCWCEVFWQNTACGCFPTWFFRKCSLAKIMGCAFLGCVFWQV